MNRERATTIVESLRHLAVYEEKTSSLQPQPNLFLLGRSQAFNDAARMVERAIKDSTQSR
jgi:hypothetical protein